MTNTNPCIAARAASVGYGRTVVVKDLNLSLDYGCVHGLIGANGTGKTTVLRALAGQIAPQGELTVFGENPFDNLRVLDRTVLMGIDVPLPEGWRVGKIFALAQARWSTWDEGYKDELVRLYEIPTDKRYSQLSRGQKSCVGIVVALASRCELVLLDEPYLGLDVDKRTKFYTVLGEHAEQTRCTVVISTHHLNEAQPLLDTVTLLGSAPLSGMVGDIAEAFLEVKGTAAQVHSLCQNVGIDADVDTQSGLAKVVLDLRGDQQRIDAVYAHAATCGVRVNPASLEQAVLTVSAEKGWEHP